MRHETAPRDRLGAPVVELDSSQDIILIHSISGVGTALLACVWAGPLPKAAHTYSLDIGAVCLPITGEQACGDGWAISKGAQRSLILVVDGLGHGPLAAEASLEAIRVFEQRSTLPPAGIIEATHASLRHTSGAVMGVAEVDFVQRRVRFSGVGNIGGVVISPERSYHMVSHNGIVGGSVGRIQEFTYPWPPEALLVMHSDGLTSQWSLGRYPGLCMRHPSLIAGVLYRDCTRRRDDVRVVIARESSL